MFLILKSYTTKMISFLLFHTLLPFKHSRLILNYGFFFFFLCKFRPIYSWVNLYSQPAGSHFGWASGPTTCFSLKINHHLWVLSIKKGAKKMGLHIFTTLWEKIISKLCFRSLWNKLKMRCLSLLQKSKL